MNPSLYLNYLCALVHNLFQLQTAIRNRFPNYSYIFNKVKTGFRVTVTLATKGVISLTMQ